MNEKAQIEAEAERVFGDSKQAKMWLQKKNIALGGSPISLLDSDAGADEVRKVLASISHGGIILLLQPMPCSRHSWVYYSGSFALFGRTI